jgi:iron(III) transport system substrate-binding protein
MIKMHRMRAWLLCLAVIPSLVACTPPETPTGGEPESAAVADPEAGQAAGSESATAVSNEAEPEPDPEAGGSSDKDLAGGDLVLYSGRGQDLVGPIIEQFEAESGIDVKVRWGDTSELAATLLEEGERSPADLFLAQDPGGLGAVDQLLMPLDDDILDLVDPKYRASDGRWVGISGRARVLVYNTDRLKPEELPASLKELTDPQWKGRIGWAPTNSSFQTMVTAMRALDGDEATLAWLEGMVANEPVAYEKNAPVVAAVGAGEVDLGLVNHYYLYRFLAEEGEDFPAKNDFMPGGGAGSMVLVAGAGVLSTAKHPEAAEALIRFLLGASSQAYFATETFEYPLALDAAIVTPSGLPPLSTLNPPSIALDKLADLEGTIALLREAGALP